MKPDPKDLFRNVLIVDDDPAIVRFVSRIVERASYSTTSATNGIDALAMLNNRQFHFLLTDLDMPQMGGIELCENLRKLDLPRYVYAIIFTGSKTDHLFESLNAGADDFIKKPLDRSELIARMIAGKRVLSLESQLRYLVSCDPLTNILNRRAFFELFEMTWRKEFSSEAHWACVMGDVDEFKQINDSFGHVAGDCVLRGVADILKDVFGDTSIIGRYGGEEFCVVLQDLEEAEAMELTESARKQIQATDFSFNGHRIPVTMSFGVAHRQYQALSPIDFLNQADIALFKAKRAGRNRVLAAPADEVALPLVTPVNFSPSPTVHFE